eukprot:4248038-Amphidinium_carterae.1
MERPCFWSRGLQPRDAQRMSNQNLTKPQERELFLMHLIVPDMQDAILVALSIPSQQANERYGTIFCKKAGRICAGTFTQHRQENVFSLYRRPSNFFCAIWRLRLLLVHS